MKNKTKGISRILTAFLAVMLCVTAFSLPAFAYGADPTGEAAETTGGIEPGKEETGKADTAAATDKPEADMRPNRWPKVTLPTCFRPCSIPR